MQQIEAGVARFVDSELAPKIPADGPNGGLKRFGVLVAISYNIKSKVPAVLASMGAVDENGNVDLEGVAELARKYMPENGLRVQVPVIDELVFYPADVDLLKRDIVGG
jgi:hypothetical protein